MTPEELYKSHEKYIEPTLQMLFGDIGFFASKYNVEPEDIIQMARIGLWKASEKYDNTKSSFKTYAIYCIKWSVLKELRYITTDIYSKKEEDKLKYSNKVNLVSCDMKISDDNEESSLYDIIPNNDTSCMVMENAIDNVRHDKLMSLIRKILSESDYEVVKWLDKGYKPIEIAKIMGVNRQRISQRMQRIRKQLNEVGVGV
ncbi:sigma-70 family RNA polymerase sigma factor [Caldifermentibacillus hisashii]|uniref:Sigma-70 family RNA polymerase sigma factor n=1 Tax=Caldifermentibacillus hisashii TaxID=996558 RepID=A0ABU9K2T8_9BACI